MSEIKQNNNITATPEFKVSRLINAPLELVWKVWTKPEHLNRWWGPKGYTMLTNKLDLKPGGIFHYKMKSPDGQIMWGKFVFREIIELEKLVFVVSFSDEFGNILRHPLSMTWPLEVLSAVSFTEKEGKTLLSISGIPINATKEEEKTFADGLESMNQGWKGTFEQLEEYLNKIIN
ncbi:MAG: SRPBCC domain-containing protein [Bacteroidetes bacterium]|nr:MAG: SRPBCC domain-containing protein [Bacteroidota bacterium]